MGFSRQAYWSGLPFPPLGDHPDPGIEPIAQTHISRQEYWSGLPFPPLGDHPDPGIEPIA